MKYSPLFLIVLFVVLATYLVSVAMDSNNGVYKSDSIVELRCDSNSVEAPVYERPQLSDNDFLVEHTGFALSFDETSNCPRWVAWELTAQEVETKAVVRGNDFRGDPLVPASHRVEASDYRESGYDRGHMCPAGDMKWSSAAMSDCFYMSNICPQVGELNRRWWEHLESACRRWARQEGSVYICCGPIFRSSRRTKTIGVGVRVRVPNGFFKVVLSLRGGAEKAIGFVYSNRDSRQPMSSAVCTVDSVETLTGLDFFPLLPDSLEERVESSASLSAWK